MQNPVRNFFKRDVLLESMPPASKVAQWSNVCRGGTACFNYEEFLGNKLLAKLLIMDQRVPRHKRELNHTSRSMMHVHVRPHSLYCGTMKMGSPHILFACVELARGHHSIFGSLLLVGLRSGFAGTAQPSGFGRSFFRRSHTSHTNAFVRVESPHFRSMYSICASSRACRLHVASDHSRTSLHM